MPFPILSSQPPISPQTIESLASAANGKTFHFHHTIELLQPAKEDAAPVHTPPTLMQRVRQITSYVLIALGLVMTFAAVAAMGLQAAAIGSASVLTSLETFFFPGLVSILTGFHLPKDDPKNLAKFRLPTPIKGLNFNMI